MTARVFRLVSSPATAPTAAPAVGGLRRYRRHFHHLRPARWHLIGGVLAGIVFAISTGAGLPAVMNYLLPIFFQQQEKIEPRVVEVAIWLFGPEDYVRSLLITACVGLPLVFLVRGVASFLNRYWINQAGFVVLEGVRLQAYTRLLDLPLAFFNRNPAGDLNARLMADTEKIRSVLVSVSSDVITQPLTLLSALGYLTYLSITNRSALFALIAMVSVPLCIIPIRMAARKLVKRSRELAQKGGELSSVSIETLQSPLEIQAYNLQDRQRDRFVVRIREIFRLSLKTIKYQAAVTPAIEVISVCGFVAALYFGTKNGLTFSAFVSLAATLYMSYAPVKKLSTLHASIKTGEAALERLEYILDAEDTVPAPSAPRSLPAGPLTLGFDHLSFAYAPRPGAHASTGEAPAALRDLTLTAAPGETIALVGASGAGKSTFVTLIPRFYDPSSGRVTLGGIDLRELDKAALRERVAVVPQQPLLFNASFAENIRLGRLTATDAEVEQAARRAHAHAFIAAQPQGYATVVGERGGTLSGGQRQRIAIARAFLKDAPILILDEATSALDSESEAAIQDALRELVKGRLTFMIAHRFSSIRHATRILVFEQGRIVADGPHETLHATSPVYRDLYDKQTLGGQAANQG
jgi:subfamily B ATP-binding cassette protein MsbA